MLVAIVKCFGTFSDGQKLVNILILRNGFIENRTVSETHFSEDLDDILMNGYKISESELLKSHNEKFLENLKFRYTGSYFRASGIEWVKESELLDL